MRSWMMVVIVGVGALCVAAASQGDEERVTLDQVPAAVKAAILKEAGGAEIREIERETEGGKTAYEAEFIRDGKEVEIAIAEDGTVLGREIDDEDDDGEEEEEAIPLEKVPGPARKALEQLAGGARITKAGREKEQGVIIYEAAWSAGGATHEAAVTEDGTLVETEQTIPLAQAPAAVRATVAKHFGAKADVVVERKVITMYEVEAKVDGRDMELLILATGRVHKDHDGDDDDDGDDGPDDDDD